MTSHCESNKCATTLSGDDLIQPLKGLGILDLGGYSNNLRAVANPFSIVALAGDALHGLQLSMS